jgi:hypothetical protein
VWGISCAASFGGGLRWSLGDGRGALATTVARLCCGVLAHSSDDLFTKELCGLLASLEAASPGYGKDIACVLAGKASDDIIRKVENSFKKVSIWGKRRKRA